MRNSHFIYRTLAVFSLGLVFACEAGVDGEVEGGVEIVEPEALPFADDGGEAAEPDIEDPEDAGRELFADGGFELFADGGEVNGGFELFVDGGELDGGFELFADGGEVDGGFEFFDGGGAGATDAGALLPDAGVDPEYVNVIDHAFLIAHFGGDPVDAFAYPDTVSGFQLYLDDVGIQYFSANEIVTPNNPSAATQCGYSVLLPEQNLWERAGALAIFADQLRILVGEPVYMRNWWRPPCYNDRVGGAATGDHPDADAVDLDFQSTSSRVLAQRFLCDNYWLEDIVTPAQLAPGSSLDPRLNMSVGLGGATIHLGALSSNGRRFWTYSSYTNEPGDGTCW